MRACKCGEQIRDDALRCHFCGRKLSLDSLVSGTKSSKDNSQSNRDIEFLEFVEKELSRAEARKVPTDESMREVLAEFEQRKKSKIQAEKLRLESFRREQLAQKRFKRDYRKALVANFWEQCAGLVKFVLVGAVLTGILHSIYHFQIDSGRAVTQARIFSQTAHIDNPSGSSPGRAMPLPNFDNALRSQSRNYKDKPDKLKGFQIHPVYVIPKDGRDNRLDTSGVLARDLHQAIQIMDSQFGDHIQIDLTPRNNYDVTFFHSTHTYKQLSSRRGNRKWQSGLDKLTAEYLKQTSDYKNRKIFVFLLDGGFRSESGHAYCGYANSTAHKMRNSAIVLTGNRCNGVQNGSDYVAQSIVHETIHALGALYHVKDSADLMCGEPYKCESQSTLYADPKHKYYFFGAKSGTDISNLRVWSKSLDNPKLKYPCTNIAKLEYECGLRKSQLLIQEFCYEPDSSVALIASDKSDSGLNQNLLIADSRQKTQSGDTCYAAFAGIDVKKSQTLTFMIESQSAPEEVTIHFRK